MERKKDKSYNQKIVFAIIHFIALLISVWVLFYPEQNFILKIIGQPKIATPLISRIIIFSCATLYFFRHIITLFVLLKREIPWNEVFGVGFFITIIQVLFAILTVYSKENFSQFDWILIGFVVFGSYLNTGSELQRMVWKKREFNRGNYIPKVCLNTRCT